VLDVDRVDWTEFVPKVADPYLPKGVVLKPCLGPDEPGVIFISFEVQWAKLLRLADRAQFARRYTLVLAPSSSPHNLVNYVFPNAWPGTVFSLISNPEDVDVLPRVSDRLHVVPLYASHWVNAALFRPVPRRDRPFDLVMVAGFGKVKRHHALFAALRRMPPDLRVLLVGQDQDGRTADAIHALARWYGVAGRYTLRANLSYAEVTEALCQARASVVLSRREGSCVVTAESLLADTPAALLDGARIGSRVFLYEETGRLLRPGHLAHDLTAFVREAERYEPRRWAEGRIDCVTSTRALNDHLRRHALAHGQAWTQDIAPLQWSPNPELARAADRELVAAERRLIRAQFGLRIGPDD
jgi:glycosyltransferase involved in cell wall biosynthesis